MLTAEPSTYAHFPIIELYGRNPQSVKERKMQILVSVGGWTAGRWLEQLGKFFLKVLFIS